MVNNVLTLHFGDGTSLNASMRVKSRDTANNDVTTELVTLNEAEEWESGVVHTYAADGNYIAYWGSGARESASSQQSGTWRNETLINIGNGNSSPVAAVPAVVQVLDNAVFRYSLAAIDPNGDDIRFRIGTQQEFYSNGSNNEAPRPTGLQLSETGAIVWDVTDEVLTTAVGNRWQMTVMIEDLTSTGAVKSKAPVDFVFIITDKIPAEFIDFPEGTVHPPVDEVTVTSVTAQDLNWESCGEAADDPTITVLNPPSTDPAVWSGSLVKNADGTSTYNASFMPTEGMAGQSYVVLFRATTCDGATSVRSVQYFVPGNNQAPSNITLSNNVIVEHSPENSVIGTFTVSDIDPGDVHTLTLTGATNTDIFKIGGSSGSQLQIASATLSHSGTYVVSVKATDSGSLSLIKDFTITLLLDEDNDLIADIYDSLIGNKTYVTTEGTTGFTVQIDETDAEGTYTGEKLTRFFDGSVEMFSFSNDYTVNVIRLANILVKKTTNALIVNTGDELPEGTKKTLYLTDNNFIALCVKDAVLTSASDISSSCDQEDEIDFSSCIGNSDGVTINDITCTDEGGRFRVDNLTHSGLLGTPPPPATTQTSTTGGQGGGGRRGFDPLVAYRERQAQMEQNNSSVYFAPCDMGGYFKDVPTGVWYENHVCVLQTAKVVSGYKDQQGNELYRYHPENNVTYAEIAKIALLASNRSENRNGEPQNRTARGDWAAPYIRTMEGLKIAEYPLSLDVKSPANRGDVISILLRVFDIPFLNFDSSDFTDLSVTDTNAQAILTAVSMGIMQGDTKETGELTQTIRPLAPINRAETAKIVHRLLQYMEAQ